MACQIIWVPGNLRSCDSHPFRYRLVFLTPPPQTRPHSRESSSFKHITFIISIFSVIYLNLLVKLGNRISYTMKSRYPRLKILPNPASAGGSQAVSDHSAIRHRRPRLLAVNINDVFPHQHHTIVALNLFRKKKKSVKINMCSD